MSFTSAGFLLFFPVVVAIYHLVPERFRHLWLLAASYYFYMSWNPTYALLMLFSTAVTYASGLGISQGRHRRLWVAISFALNLAVLFFFKYFDFAFDTLATLVGAWGAELARPGFDVLLPVGISFYTFQALSYTMDVYRGEVEPERNFLRYALFVSFFPQLVAGPIERSKNLLGQLRQPSRLDVPTLWRGISLMIWGYFLKLVLADRAAIFVDATYGDPAAWGGAHLVVATVLFALQIYCDFGGYTCIAIGAASILGIRLMENFNAPHLSRSVAEFWRNWHISLTSWFRDYLYIPLGGNRRGRVRKYVNVMIVFLVSGLWHGASWSFVIWGGLNGLYQVIGELTRSLRGRVLDALHIRRDGLPHQVAQIIITFVLIDFAWIFFRAGSLQGAMDVIVTMVSTFDIAQIGKGQLFSCGLGKIDFALLALGTLVLLAADVCKRRGICVRDRIGSLGYWARCLTIVVGVVVVLLVGIWGYGYDEASFIYFQF